jgi:hypothetical protein
VESGTSHGTSVVEWTMPGGAGAGAEKMGVSWAAALGQSSWPPLDE